MATTQETQSFLDAVKTPSVVAPNAVLIAMKAFVRPLGELRQQTALWSRLLQVSQLADMDARITGKYEQCFQGYGAVQREAERVEQSLRSLMQSLRALEALDGEMRLIASELGYTV